MVDARGSASAIVKVSSRMHDRGQTQDRALPDLRRSRADCVKTSTGYGDGGTTDEDLKLMRKHTARTSKSKPRAASATCAGLKARPRPWSDASRRHRFAADSGGSGSRDELAESPMFEVRVRRDHRLRFRIVASVATAIRRAAPRRCGTTKRPGGVISSSSAAYSPFAFRLVQCGRPIFQKQSGK